LPAPEATGWERSRTNRQRRRQAAALAGLLASAALVSAACSANHRPGTAAAPAVSRGTASWYGPKFNGRRTANGERYDMRSMTAAHRNLPFGTLVQVTNLENGRQAVVRINDRGPYGRRRVIDLSYAAARQLGMIGAGTARVEMAVLPAVNRYDPATQLPQPMLLASAGAPPPAVAQAAVAQPATAQPTAAPGQQPSPVESSAIRVTTARGQQPSPAEPSAVRFAVATDAGTMAAPAVAAGTEAAETAPAATRPRTATMAAAVSDHRAATEPLAATPVTIAAAIPAAVPASLVPAGQAAAATGRGVHFTVQVGAFGELDRASALQQELAHHYPEAAVHSDGTWNRVQVGRFADREQAEELRRDIAALGLAAVVVAAR
jgi:rare lipoprotein A